MQRQGILPISQGTEDAHKQGFLQQPSQNEHYFLHPKQSDSYTKQIYDCRDMLYDPHWEVKNTFKYALKGALIGGLLGTSICLTQEKIPTLVLKKLFKFAKDNNFGGLQMAKYIIAPYATVGGFVGATWYMWYHLVWTPNSNRGAFLDHISGYGLYGMGAASLLWHPKMYWAGFWGGAFLGFASWFFYSSNSYNNANTVGFYVPIGDGLNEEEKERQRNRDIVFELSQVPHIKYGQLKGL